ncbi:hypothetical protein AAE02nite_19280 [Adhaeribacter aerolatus]|uniref:Activator of Hsp90 ATPase homologue 1/2-like C-terminal domain-containing protein n=1 Tax=Adhaeribacter aerolatus TaxID=670289 RepID=A0A512AX42_9BACT|nr:SRPBCC domain-containing protein [Adhaeribacter aerolatus]GEO04264.1 hypothetical protein AAE02nite_19280 [Adhaeribacter aerolatus]
MQQQPFVIERTYNAPVQAVWEAITDKDKMKQWYFDLEAFKPEVGFEFRFYGGDDENQFLHICRITEVIPGQKLTHTWQYEGQPEETFVTFELFPEGNQTRLKLTHEGLEKIAGYGPMFARENFVAGWTDIIGNLLKDFVEKN